MTEAQPGVNCSVLLAEDDESIRRTLQSLLEMKGYGVAIAQDTEEVLGLLEAQDFDLVISDYLMPGGGGREMLRYLNEEDKHPAIIMITGLADEQLFGELVEQGVARCLSKPFRLAALLMTIEDVLKERALPQ
jgi:two-component system, NarL family, capsular synthesis sensor histidine kinase RcsC